MSKSNGTSAKVSDSFTELCRYADKYHLVVEIEKPFQQFDKLFLKLINADGEETHRVLLNDIASLDKESGTLLNEISKTKH